MINTVIQNDPESLQYSKKGDKERYKTKIITDKEWLNRCWAFWLRSSVGMVERKNQGYCMLLLMGLGE